MKKLTAIVLGYGMRSETYSNFAIQNPDKLEIIAVAVPFWKKIIETGVELMG